MLTDGSNAFESFSMPIIAPIIIAAVVAWLFGLTADGFVITFFIVCISPIAFLILQWFFSSKAKAAEKARAHRRLELRQEFDATDLLKWHALAEQHRNALVLRYRQTVAKNEYGAVDMSAWRDKEIPRFRKSVGIAGRDELISRFDMELSKKVTGWVFAEDGAKATISFTSSNPYEFEQWCARILRDHGWDASATKGSGDQGLDVLAVKGKLKVAIQCKLFTTGAVGNKAVQEVHAAAAFVDAGNAAVVSNAAYTPAARQLASKLGVHLLHDSQLPNLEEIVGGGLPLQPSGIILPGQLGSGLIIPSQHASGIVQPEDIK